MHDWITPFDQADASIQEARAAFKRADAAGMKEALCEAGDLVNELLYEIDALLCESAESSNGS